MLYVLVPMLCTMYSPPYNVTHRHFLPVYLHSYHVEYTTDVGFPEEKTALAWSFRADLKQRSLLLRPGIDDGVPNSVPTHTVLRAHVVRSVCVSLPLPLPLLVR